MRKRVILVVLSIIAVLAIENIAVTVIKDYAGMPSTILIWLVIALGSGIAIYVIDEMNGDE